jgi:hypothetical protein
MLSPASTPVAIALVDPRTGIASHFTSQAVVNNLPTESDADGLAPRASPTASRVTSRGPLRLSPAGFPAGERGSTFELSSSPRWGGLFDERCKWRFIV